MKSSRITRTGIFWGILWALLSLPWFSATAGWYFPDRIDFAFAGVMALMLALVAIIDTK